MKKNHIYSSQLPLRFMLILMCIGIVSCGGGEGEASSHELKQGIFSRSYRLYLPKDYDPTDKTNLPALVFYMHAYFVDGFQYTGSPKLEAIADRENFIVVYPRAVSVVPGPSIIAPGFNAGPSCCVPGAQLKTKDVDFVRMVYNDIQEEHEFDTKRVYATGLSAGSGMSFRLAVEASDLFTAVVGVNMPYLNGLDTIKSKIEEPVSVISFDGVNDGIAPYGGGIGYLAYAGILRVPSRQENFAAFKEANDCVGEPEISHTNEEIGIVCRTYTDCRRKSDSGFSAEITQCDFNKSNHFVSLPPAGSVTDELIWTYMSKYTK